MDIERIIKEYPDITLSVKVGDLLDFGQSIATNAVKTFIEQHDEKIFSRTELIEKFKICSATLWRWEKLKLITSKKIGNRSFYSESDIKKLMDKER